MITLYADYQRLNWQPTWHHDRQMLKGFIAYNTSPITIGVEAYVNNIRNDTKGIPYSGQGPADTIGTKAQGISFFIHGDIIKEKLRFFARWDLYNPNKNISSNSQDSSFSALSSPSGYGTGSYKTVQNNTGAVASATSLGDITSKETFVTVGLDYMPYRNVHFEPNIWYNHYNSQLTTVPGMMAGANNANHDLVWRLTFFFVFGKNYKNTYNQF